MLRQEREDQVAGRKARKTEATTDLPRLASMRRVRYSLGQNFIKHDFRYCALVD